MYLRRKNRIKKAEIIHYYSGKDIISSWFNKISIKFKKYNTSLTLPLSVPMKVLGQIRIFRRLLRLDKCNVFVSNDFLIIIKNYKVYSYNLETKKLSEVLTLKNCRNILHQSMATNKEGTLFFGEYGNNDQRKPVYVYKSSNNGQSWEVVYKFEAGEIKHIHGCYYDAYEDKIWTLTGDFEKENIVMKSNLDFTENEKIGDGSQIYRAVNIFFKEKSVHWIMDSPIERSYHYEMDRSSFKITRKDGFPGPVWYLKKLSDGYYLAASSVEIGEGVYDNYAHLFVSKDLKNWNEVAKFKKDILPMRYFKWGVIGFAEGDQDSSNFALFFEALNKVDGKSYIYKLDD